MVKKHKFSKALLLYSGGLDSILAAKILVRQGIDVTVLTFQSYFFDARQAKKSAAANKIKLRIEDFSDKHLKIVKKPRFGRGAGMNPCVDCHLLMIKEAKKIMRKENYDFIATGEVLGQRPMSQNSEALKLIEREAGLIGKILRPLSAKVLPPTEYEKRNLVSREKLYGFFGRGRGGQIKLARKYKIKNYPSPAGGCILTDKEFSKKLRELFERVKKIKPSDIELLRLGRHFWTRAVRKFNALKTKNVLLKNKSLKKISEPKLSNGAKVILGRNHEENLKLKKLAEYGDILIELENIPGPLALIRGKGKKEALELAKEKIVRYAKKLKEKNPEFKYFEI